MGLRVAHRVGETAFLGESMWVFAVEISMGISRPN